MNKYLVIVIMFFVSATSAWANMPNLPPSATIILDCAFNSITCSGAVTNFYVAGSIISNASAPESPPNVYRYERCASCVVGGTQLDLNFSEASELYIGLAMRSSPNFPGYTVNTNKIVMPGNLEGNFIFGLYGTQAERQATAAKYVTLYQEIKSRRPGWRIGWYTDPVRRQFFSSIADPASAGYRTWQAENNDLAAIMAPFTDVFMPSLYVHYSSDHGPQNLDWITTYLIAHINEAKRLRRMYGRMESPIYPYVWWRRADDARDLDAHVWELVVRTVLEHADGLVLWGGFKTTAPAGPLPWDENAPWWVTIKARLTDKRRTQ